MIKFHRLPPEAGSFRLPVPADDDTVHLVEGNVVSVWCSDGDDTNMPMRKQPCGWINRHVGATTD